MNCLLVFNKPIDRSIEASAIAELEEETGIRTELENLIPLGKISNTPTKSSHITFGFLATGLTFNSQQDLEITEELKIITKSPTEVIEMIKDGKIWVGDTVAFIMKAYLLFPEIFEEK